METVNQNKKFRPEIEGLRVIAALLVAVYHIWLGKVSGGVDVFFVVSGFLITTSLLSKVRRTGTVNFFDFIFGLLRRLVPAAFFILFTVIVLSYFFLPEVQWSQTIKEIFASAFYYENWQLAYTATDYLDHTNAKSPVQHFWAMSIQGQFYIIWFLLIWLAIWSAKWMKTTVKKPLFILFLILFAVSFVFSVYLTAINQPWAYFDTRTRVWEFALGGLLCLLLTRIKLPHMLAGLLGWLGLLMLVSCGLMLNVSSLFPGYVALWPTLAAVFILISGENPSKFGVEKLLGTAWMVKLGALSYGFYLWHWVVLTFYHVFKEVKHVPLTDGLLILAGSLLLSWLTTRFVERPLRKLKFPNKSARTALLLGSLLAIVAGSNAFWFYQMSSDQVADQKLIGSDDYPGARSIDMDNVPQKDYLPEAEAIKNDKADPYTDGCHVAAGDPVVKVCEYGVTENYDYTVALVGSSHAAHWQPALVKMAEKNKIRVLNITKSGCRFSTYKAKQPSCIAWNQHVIDKIVAEKPDIVFANADVGYWNIHEVPVGYIEQFEALNKKGIEVFGVRDTPYFRKDVPTCVNQYGADSPKCQTKREVLFPEPSDWAKLKNPPENVHVFDYTDFFCDEEVCRPVIGNVMVYVDNGHISRSYMETLSPYIEKDLIPLLKKAKAKRLS
ncbi:acyltransferase family protein [Macrococcus bovicus]|uniref:acyltransferase family protein n=1 Tax=Macrococcus bovicus TaxID=69968 RepID=UPI0025A597FD|nr:acyltransferase family protein [Macrococcus bovicus]WJP98218.1 acyltransferase family protein [Macrococcus bovicus]